ncbi:MAG: sugar phosphate isomerase/epimerase family protein, partial [Solirubrobacteraceae bacterium]
MRRAISTASLSGSLEDKLLVAARAGFDGVELFETDLIGSNASVAELRSYVDQLGLEIMLYVPLRDFEAVDDATFARNLHRAVGKLDVMQRLGARLLLVCSNASDDAVDDDRRAGAQLAELAELAAARGIRIAYDALPWARYVSDYEHA